MIKLIKGTDVKLVDENSQLIEKLIGSGWKKEEQNNAPVMEMSERKRK